MSAPSTPPMFLLYADVIAGTPRDKSDGIAVDKRRTGRLLSIPLWAARSIRPWRMNIVFSGSTFASLIVDGIRLVDLIVPVRKVPVRNRALASSIDVKKQSQKTWYQRPKSSLSLNKSNTTEVPWQTPEVTGLNFLPR